MLDQVRNALYPRWRGVLKRTGLIKRGAAPELGGEPYFDFLRRAHRELKPGSYLEIGVRKGESLKLATCPAIGIDPQHSLTDECKVARAGIPTHLFSEFSDDFFKTDRLVKLFPERLDLAFIDGDHRFEFALRDFMNLERLAHPRTIIAIHDCCPTNRQMASRNRRRFLRTDFATMGRWAGDGWKLLPILKKYRPDLAVLPVDCPPTGLLIIAGLDPASTVLSRAYDDIMREFTGKKLDLPRHRAAFPLVASRTVSLPALVSNRGRS